jgi:hypothetical protein
MEKDIMDRNNIALDNGLTKETITGIVSARSQGKLKTRKMATAIQRTEEMVLIPEMNTRIKITC